MRDQSLEAWFRYMDETLEIERNRIATRIDHQAGYVAETSRRVRNGKMLNSLGEWQNILTLECQMAAYEARRDTLKEVREWLSDD